MTTLQWFLVAGLTLAFALVVRAILAQPDLERISCGVKPLCSCERRQFWLTLQRAAGENHLVLAFVPLATVLAATQEKGQPLDEWLQRHWVDFVILEEKSFLPVAVVQLERSAEDDDPLWQPGRDPRLKSVLARAGLPVLWLPSERYQHVELLRHALEQLWKYNPQKGSGIGGHQTAVDI